MRTMLIVLTEYRKGGIIIQTFLPYPDFKLSVSCLDNKRLGKQRVEALQILNILTGKQTTKGFINHPIVKMWRGYEDALRMYMNACIEEWIKRGFNNNMRIEEVEKGEIVFPPWLGKSELHFSHRCNLLRKDFKFYSKYGWIENSMNYSFVPYFWGSKYGYGKIPNDKNKESKKIVKSQIAVNNRTVKEWKPRKWILTKK